MPDQTPSTPPPVSVIMPVHNGARFLRAAIDSILRQTWRDFEFIIIDDGSTDATPAILAGYAARDARIRIDTLPENQGIVAALNRGGTLARGRYLARMDADDISLPDRLRIQANTLDRHPEIGVVGASVRHIDEHGTPGAITHPPLSPGLIRWRAFFASPMAHSTIMMRKTVFEQAGGYVAGMAPAEDYDLWLRISAISDLANLPDVLLHYRVWEGSVTSQHSAHAQTLSVILVRRSISDLLGGPLPDDMAAALRAVMALDKSHWPYDPAAIRDTAAWLVRVCETYTAKYGPSPNPLPIRDGEGATSTLSRPEAKAIKGEVAFRLVLLAQRISRSAPRASVRLILSALHLYPLVTGHVIGKLSARMLKKGKTP